MSQKLYRVLYRGNGREDWKIHRGRSGNEIYFRPSSAKAAITQFLKQDRYYGGGTMEYKIQQTDVEWNDVELPQA
jgi:hypothetical protein